jgi:phosphohistidine phosphatase SixA
MKLFPDGMNMRVSRLFTAAMLLLATAAPTLPAQQAPTSQRTTVILVRHAEKEDATSNDPGLSAVGARRAAALVTALDGARVSRVLTTNYRRTRDTGAPIATKAGITAEVIAVGDRHTEAVAEAVRRGGSGVILVVGHSNTLPAIVAALGAPAPAAICDSEYDDMFILMIGAGAPTSVVRARYGEPSPRGGGCPTMR